MAAAAAEGVADQGEELDDHVVHRHVGKEEADSVGGIQTQMKEAFVHTLIKDCCLKRLFISFVLWQKNLDIVHFSL